MKDFANTVYELSIVDQYRSNIARDELRKQTKPYGKLNKNTNAHAKTLCNLRQA
jgi:hypothetical protein